MAKTATSKLSVTLTDAMRTRLDALALRMEQTPTECVEQAILEFVENWEDHLRVVAALQEDEARPILSTAGGDQG
jgi:predicted transcriptional regulator